VFVFHSIFYISQTMQMHVLQPHSLISRSVEDEDEMLYGESDSGLTLASAAPKQADDVRQDRRQTRSADGAPERGGENSATFWVVVTRDNQTVEVTTFDPGAIATPLLRTWR